MVNLEQVRDDIANVIDEIRAVRTAPVAATGVEQRASAVVEHLLSDNAVRRLRTAMSAPDYTAADVRGVLCRGDERIDPAVLLAVVNPATFRAGLVALVSDQDAGTPALTSEDRDAQLAQLAARLRVLEIREELAAREGAEYVPRRPDIEHVEFLLALPDELQALAETGEEAA